MYFVALLIDLTVQQTVNRCNVVYRIQICNEICCAVNSVNFAAGR